MPTRRALPMLLSLLLLALPLRAPAAEVLESATPDFGSVSVSFTGATLTLTFGADVLASLPLGVGRTALTLLADPVELPQGARKDTIFDHAEIDFNPLGHPPSGKTGGYGTPHFDLHFFVRPFDAAGRRSIRLASAYNVSGGASNATAVAAAAAAATAEFLAPPPAALLPSESDMVLDPESLVPSQGVHWVPASDWAEVYRSQTHTGMLGAWSGLSYMYGTFNASITFLEVMVSVNKLGELAKGRQSRAEEAAVPQPSGGAAAIKQVWGDALFPTRYFVSYDNASDAYSVGWRFAAVEAAGAR